MPDLKELLINEIRREVLVEALDGWIDNAEASYRAAETEDEAANIATKVHEGQELYRELTGKEWKA